PGDLVDVERGLGGEDDLRSPGDPGLDGDPPGLPAHELDDHDPVVALRSGVDPVDRLGGDVHGRVEADGAVGAGDVVVDRLGDGDDRQTGLRALARRVEGAVTADADQAVDPLRLQRGVDRLQATLNGVRVVARRAQQGATGVEDPADVAAGELLHVPLGDTLPPVAEADDGVAVLAQTVLHHCPDGGVEAGTVSTAGEQTDSHSVSFASGVRASSSLTAAPRAPA